MTGMTPLGEVLARFAADAREFGCPFALVGGLVVSVEDLARVEELIQVSESGGFNRGKDLRARLRHFQDLADLPPDPLSS